MANRPMCLASCIHLLFQATQNLQRPNGTTARLPHVPPCRQSASSEGAAPEYALRRGHACKVKQSLTWQAQTHHIHTSWELQL
ncbi:hypothetical protein BS50DRAFT_142356 [Corynespora cassiicola Philippines]|uniref:Uncharacterized protein n=1 Tax=Corynespora cassiicola Philippines TaxID=1448308 RepID=A0A2T2NA35_CORCC|nr:hypothetical protein BS50DRAFT_142356 [Corynespora cassiicola Philippines]